MKLPTDVIKMYKEIHGWVGIVSGLALFIAFFAGALTMFEDQVQRWASPPTALAAPPSLARTPELVAKVLAAHPEAKKGYAIHLMTDNANPARVSWDVRQGRDEHAASITHYAALNPDGSLQVVKEGPSAVAQFIDVLHQEVGLTFLDHEIAMPIMGTIALLYFVAIVSGLVVLLPSLVSDLFAMRLGKNVKRMWLDAHNLLGVFSLPFHIIMALTALVFAFHDQFYGAQGLAFGGAERERPAAIAKADMPPMLPPAQLVERLRQQAPEFTPLVLDISQRPDGSRFVRVGGLSERHAMRGPTMGYGSLDPATGELTGKDYMPGHQDGWSAAVTSFFSLHFGAFGGAPIRWSYFLLGLAGAFIFYTGNLLWIESRRKRERKSGAVEQTKATKILGALTVGVPTGTIAGIAVTLAAAKPLGSSATPELHSAIFYSVFVLFVSWSLIRGSARSGSELGYAATACLASVPASTLAFVNTHPASVLGVDFVAAILCLVQFLVARAAKLRSQSKPHDSVWSGLHLRESFSSGHHG